MTATVFAPGSIGNCGPGFDVLGLAVEAVGDRVTVELTDGDARIASVTGRDADLVPLDPHRNAAWLAATAWLRAHGHRRNAVVSLEKGLPVAGGLGGSAASPVAKACTTAAVLAICWTHSARPAVAGSSSRAAFVSMRTAGVTRASCQSAATRNATTLAGRSDSTRASPPTTQGAMLSRCRPAAATSPSSAAATTASGSGRSMPMANAAA